MAFALNPIAVTNADVLRAIEAGGWSSRLELAQSVGKDPRNFPRDVGVLTKAGLIEAGQGIALHLTDEGRAQLDGIARAQSDAAQGAAADLLPDERLVVHAQLRPDPDNPRKDFQSDDAEEGLDELRQSILLRGRLLQNLVVRADPDGVADYIVTTGNRRWHAIQQAIWDGDWPEDRLIRVVVREGTAQEHLLTAVTENMIRRNMLAIEEAEAFGELINVHGLKTIDIHHETGLSQKVIQNRLKLLKLSDDDRERMRLPEDHPEHLGYKVALRQLTVAREPDPAPSLSQQIAEHGAAVMTDREPGSSTPSPNASPTPAEVPTLGKSLTDREALLLAEITDKAERDPDPVHGSEHYTAALSHGAGGLVPVLATRGLLSTRMQGMSLLIRPRLFTSGLKEWLESIGFYADRESVLFELAARVEGADNVSNRRSCGVRYANPWLNMTGDPRNDVDVDTVPGPSPEGRTLPQTKQNPTPSEEAESGSSSEPDQPELIEATEEEKAERQRIEDERACAARSQAAAERLAGLATDWMGFARARGARDYLNPCFEGGGVISNEAMALELIGAIVDGRTGEAAALLATLNVRAGVIGAQQTLKSMSLFKIQNAVSDARKAETAA